MLANTETFGRGSSQGGRGQIVCETDGGERASVKSDDGKNSCAAGCRSVVVGGSDSQLGRGHMVKEVDGRSGVGVELNGMGNGSLGSRCSVVDIE